MCTIVVVQSCDSRFELASSPRRSRPLPRLATSVAGTGPSVPVGPLFAAYLFISRKNLAGGHKGGLICRFIKSVVKRCRGERINHGPSADPSLHCGKSCTYLYIQVVGAGIITRFTLIYDEPPRWWGESEFKMERCINVCEEMYWRQIEKIFSLGARKQGALHFETLRDAYQNNRPGPFPPTVFLTCLSLFLCETSFYVMLSLLPMFFQKFTV